MAIWRHSRWNYIAAALVAGALFSVTATIESSSYAQAAVIGGILPTGGDVVDEHVVSLREELFHNVIRQHTDFSCGAAAMATVLRYAYNLEVDETSIIAEMLKVSDPLVVRERGFSMLDMKRYANAIGLQGIGFRLTFQQALQLRVPAIILLNVKGYDHFVVLKKVTPAYVYVADPALGNRRLAAEEFEQGWNGVIFIVKGNDYIADNPLVDVHGPATAGQLLSGLLATTNPLADATLTEVIAPAYYRL